MVTQLGNGVEAVEVAARRVHDYIAANDLHDVVLIAHSKGGLIGKYLMVRLDRQARIDGMIAINAPFSGSFWGDIPVPTLRVFSPSDVLLRFLGGPSEVNRAIVSLYSFFDQNVWAGSRLTGARNVRLPVAGHSRILGSRALRALLPEAIGWVPSASFDG